MLQNNSSTLLIILFNILILIYSFLIHKKVFKSYACVTITFLFSLFFFFFHTVIYSYIYYSNNSAIYYSCNFDPKYIFYAGVFTTFCNLFYTIGVTLYFLKKHKIKINIKRFINDFDSKHLFKLGITLFLIGAFTKLVFFTVLGHGNLLFYIKNYFNIQLTNSSEGGTFANYLQFLFVLIDIGSDLLLINALKYKNKKGITWLAIIFAFLLSFNVRMSVLKLMVQYIVIGTYYCDAFRKKIVALFVSVFLPLIFIFVVSMGFYRDYTNGVVKTISPSYMFFGSIHTMKAMADGLEHKQCFGNLQYGKTIIMPVIQKPIPRSIWKNKTLNGAAVYTENMYPGSLESGYAIAPGICFDLFLNFGIIGTLIFFALLGAFLAFIQKVFLETFYFYGKEPCSAIFIAIAIAHLLMLRGTDVSSYIVYLIYYYLPLFLVFVKVKFKI